MNILLLNGGKSFGHSHGRLNATLHDVAKETLSGLGHVIQETVIDAGYDIETEIEKYLWADAIVYQMPGWWMGEPWIVKKYIDEVFSAGTNNGIYANDGRSRSDASKRYGSGGLMQGKKYMLSLTYNCPTSEFSNKEGFFDGLSLDEANIATHKTWQFCGATPMQTYSVHDIFKGDLNIEAEKAKFIDILSKNFLG